MKNLPSIALMLLMLPAFTLLHAQAPAPDQKWKLDQSTLTYHLSHPMHEMDGTTHAALGQGVCHAGQCDFLVAVAVKSFDSGDSNRDLHMIQTTRGAQFPIVQVRFRLAQSSLDSSTLDCDLEVQFAGNTMHYAHVPFQQTIQGTSHHITGVVPSTVKDFKIDPPTFLTIPIKNEIPVRVDMVWHAQP
jgi:hypothetical protein